MKDRIRLYLICSIAGVLMGISWPYTGSLTPLIFIAFVPILYTEWYFFTRKLRPRRIILPLFSAFFIFNLISTWWLYYASAEGVIMAVIVNAIMMTSFVYLFHLIHKRLGHIFGYLGFIAIWMTYELGQYYWELSWPWLNLGNAFSIRTTWVQWYEFTGIGGGTLWILVSNLLVFKIVQEIILKKSFSKKAFFQMGYLVGVISFPIIISTVLFNNYSEEKNPIDVVVVQPNIDPYADKFRGMSGIDQMTVFYRNAFQAADSTAEFILGPETVLPYTIVENVIDKMLEDTSNDALFDNELAYVRRMFDIMPKTEMFLGMSSKKYFMDNEDAPANAREDGKGMVSEHYNSVLYIEPSLTYDIYHKKFLVLGVEKIPFGNWIPALNDWALSLGGSSQTLGASEEPDVVKSKFTNAIITTAICYESIFGNHIAHATRMGANVIFIMTNDAWWENTPGHKQHFSYARLRAIELRRSVARSANTGISGFIDQRGQIIQSSDYWVPTALRQKINLNEKLTFYARTGDLLYGLCLIISLASILVWIYYVIRGKRIGDTREI